MIIKVSDDDMIVENFQFFMYNLSYILGGFSLLTFSKHCFKYSAQENHLVTSSMGYSFYPTTCFNEAYTIQFA